MINSLSKRIRKLEKAIMETVDEKKVWDAFAAIMREMEGCTTQVERDALWVELKESVEET